MVSSMRDAMVHAKMGLRDLRDGIASTEARLTAERAELETVRRRQGLAAGINDTETVAIAERFAAQHAERIAVLESKVMVQQQELALAERELDEMTSQLRMAASGIAPEGIAPEVAARREVDAMLADDAEFPGSGRHDPDAGPGDPASGQGTPARRTRAEREADAEERLAALKRRMGK